jgi:hypothetical protein
MNETGSGPSRGPWRPGRLGVGVLALAALAAVVVVASAVQLQVTALGAGGALRPRLR